MSLLGAFVRDVVEPVALSILQWAWTFDPAHTAPAFTLPFRFYAYSATSVLLWLYELLPHWLLLTLLILGTFSVLAIALLIFCYPFRLLNRCFVVIFKLSLLLFRCVAVGIVRLGIGYICGAAQSQGFAVDASINLVSRSVFLLQSYGLLS